MSAENVRYEVTGRVAIVTLDRPRYRNAQSFQLLDELDEALDRAQADHDVRVVVVRGEGEHFSAGHDLGTPEQVADYKQRGIPPVGIEEYEAFRKYNLDLTLKWRNLPKPTVAMVHGYCIYGGWMIAAAMDVIFASPDAKFLAGQVEYFSIPFDIGFRKAKELLFESRFIDAEEARALGFVNRVYPADQLETETLAWAARAAESGYGTLRMAKLAVNKMQDQVGFSSAMEAAFADFLVLARMGGHPPKPRKQRRLGGVDLALRGARGERSGDAPE
ncbi:MAG: enoyl-CoA hydratase/isomerase family protein [Deltaproteobacteria bacterium]|jgi:enoyl-CoA hydratase|nr:enoyl-CoA hydratase/isomerase family protein [Deltaproteobacteria bacterium]MBW2415105.1 enoyl-CoA hydratase/isomerase family protein [Deltaproteobacteria bacterium]